MSMFRADRFIRVSDCSIRVPLFYANYAPKLHQNARIMLDSVSVFMKLFKHNSHTAVCTVTAHMYGTSKYYSSRYMCTSLSYAHEALRLKPPLQIPRSDLMHNNICT